MATVSTFSEFLIAAAEPYTSVTCPEGAVWDLAEIDPDNVITSITIRAEITGNNTEIRNFRGKIVCSDQITISELHIINQLCESGGTYAGAIYGSSYNVAASRVTVWEKSRISIATGSSVENALYNIKIKKCAANISMLASGSCAGAQYYDADAVRNEYNKIQFSAPNAAAIIPCRYNYYSQLIINAPLATALNGSFTNCTLRGNMGSLAASSGSKSNGFSVITGVPAAYPDVNNRNCVKVTDAQMRDAAYLQSIGFVIGTE